MSIEVPAVEQANGYTFAPSYVPEANKGQDPALKNLDERLSSFTQKFIDAKYKEDNTAFMQGIIDKSAGQVQESSWLTPDSYRQGVAYKDVADSNSGASAKIQQLAQDEINKENPSLNSFNESVKGVMAEVNNELRKKGLTGSALELAQKQIIHTAISAQGAFQKELELRNERNINTAGSTTMNTAFNTLDASQYAPGTIQTVLGNTQQALTELYKTDKNEKDPVGRANKMLLEGLKGKLANANAGTADGQQAIANINAYLRSDHAIGTFGKAYPDATVAMAGKIKEVQGYNSSTLSMQFREMERQVNNGMITPTHEEYQQKYMGILGMLASGTLTHEDANKLYGQLWEVEKGQYKDTTKNAALMSLDPTVRMGIVGADHNSKQTDVWFQTVGSTIANSGQRALAGIEFGIQANNPNLVTRASKEFAPAINSMLLADPKKFDEQVPTEYKDTWRTFGATYQNARQSNPAFATAMLDGLPEDQRVAVEQMMLSGNRLLGRNVQADMEEMKGIMETRTAKQAAGGFAGAFTRKDQFTADDFKESIITGRLLPIIGMGDRNTVGADNYWNRMNEQGRDRLAHLANNAAAKAMPEMNAMEARGMLIDTKPQKIKALVDLGYLMRTDTGAVGMTPKFKTAMMDGYKKVAGYGMSEELASRTLSVIQDDYWNKFNGKGGRDFDREDVVVEVDGSIMRVYAYKNGANLPYEQQKWGVSHLWERAYNIEQADKKKSETVPIGEVQYGRNSLPIMPKLQDTFKGGLTSDIVSSLIRFEGNTGAKVNTPDKNRPEIQTVGMGVRIDGKFGNEPERKAIKNATTKQEYDTAMNNFLAKYYAGFDKLVSSAGLPPMEQANAKGGRTAYIALANAHYQSPGAGQEYASILTQAKTDLPGAQERLKKSMVFKDLNSTSNGKGLQADRFRFYNEGLRAANRANKTEGILQKFGMQAFANPSSYPKASDFGLPMR